MFYITISIKKPAYFLDLLSCVFDFFFVYP